jgi:protein-tyrosine phosphatase
MKTVPKIYWIETPGAGRLAVSARPRGGDWLADEVEGWRDAGVNVVVSLLTPEEIDDLDLTREGELVAAEGMRYLSLAIPDRDVPPSQADALRLVGKIVEEVGRGSNVLVHCRGGIGRSGLIAASALASFGVAPGECLRRISAVRGVEVPETEPQHHWFERVAPSLTTPNRRAEPAVHPRRRAG